MKTSAEGALEISEYHKFERAPRVSEPVFFANFAFPVSYFRRRPSWRASFGSRSELTPKKHSRSHYCGQRKDNVETTIEVLHTYLAVFRSFVQTAKEAEEAPAITSAGQRHW